MTVYVTGPRDKHAVRPDKLYPGITVVNTTSKAGWSSDLSPFRLGPVKFYGGHTARNMENAWQYAKVYPEYATKQPCGVDALRMTPFAQDPTADYWSWAEAGWANPRAVRYPVGKGRKPLYSLWGDGRAQRRLGYVEARKRVYLPLYAALVVETDGFKRCQELAAAGDLCLWDFDGYNHRAATLPGILGPVELTLTDTLNRQDRPMGHAFVLAMLLAGELDPQQVRAWYRGEVASVLLNGQPLWTLEVERDPIPRALYDRLSAYQQGYATYMQAEWPGSEVPRERQPGVDAAEFARGTNAAMTAVMDGEE